MLKISALKHKLESFHIRPVRRSLVYLDFDHYLSSTYPKCISLSMCNKPWPDLLSLRQEVSLLAFLVVRKLANSALQWKINTGLELCLLPRGLPFNQHASRLNDRRCNNTGRMAFTLSLQPGLAAYSFISLSFFLWICLYDEFRIGSDDKMCVLSHFFLSPSIK